PVGAALVTQQTRGVGVRLPGQGGAYLRRVVVLRGRRDLLLLQGVGHDVLEDRCGDLAAVVALDRALEDHGDDELGVVRGGEADEARGLAGVPARLAVVAVGRPGLARAPVALDPRLGGGALLGDDTLEHPGDLVRGLRRHRAGALALRAVLPAA